LEFRVEVQLSHQVSTHEVFSEHFNNAPSKVSALLGTLSENENANRKQQLVEPRAPPVNILLGIVQEVSFFPKPTCQAFSVPYGSKFLEDIYKDED